MPVSAMLWITASAGTPFLIDDVVPRNLRKNQITMTTGMPTEMRNIPQPNMSDDIDPSWLVGAYRDGWCLCE